MGGQNNADTKLELDWSRLLGFDQIKAADRGNLKITDLRLTKIGSKTCTIRPPQNIAS